MNRLIELKQKKAEVSAQAGAVAKKAADEGRLFTSDEQAQIVALETQLKELNTNIELLEKVDTMVAAASGMGTPGSSSTSTGTGVRPHVEFITDNDLSTEILFGRERMDRAKSLGRSETTEERRSRLSLGFGEQLQAVKEHELAKASGMTRPADKRLQELQSRYEKRAAAAGASEAVPADGGFLIQPDFSQEMLIIAHDTGLVYPRARKLPLSEWTNAIRVPGIAESSRVDGSRWGGVQMFWQNEADSLVGKKPTFRLVELVLKKLTGLYYATDELLQDTRVLGSVVMQAFGEEMGFKMDDGCIRGTGSGQLSGILNSQALVTVTKETGQAAATIVFENIVKMWKRMWNRSRQNSVWFINQDTEDQLFGLSKVVGVGGMPVYLPPGGLSASPYATLFGRPVIAIEQCDTLGQTGDIILADFTQYLLADKGDMQSAVSQHVRFLTDEMTFRWIYRVDGQNSWFNVLTPFKGTNTLAPFVVLGTR